MFTEVVLQMASRIMPPDMQERITAARRVVVEGYSLTGLEYLKTHGVQVLDSLSLCGHSVCVEDQDGAAFLWDWDEAAPAIGLKAPRRYWVCSRVGDDQGVREREYMHSTGTIHIAAIDPLSETPFEGNITVWGWSHTTADKVLDGGGAGVDSEFSDTPWRLGVRALLLFVVPEYRRLLE